MSTAHADRVALRYRERAAACRRLSQTAYTVDLGDSYTRLALSYDLLADTVEELVGGPFCLS